MDQNCQSTLILKNGTGCGPHGGHMAPYGPIQIQNVNSPFRFSICIFSENFSPNKPKLPKNFNIQNGTGHGEKGINVLCGNLTKGE